MATSAINNFLAVFKNDATALPPPVRFIPAAFLFVHAEPLPDGMQPSEVEGFAGVTLEGLSPLPLEQLAWGYAADTRSRHILLFGAFQDRLNVESLSADETFYHVLPSFFAAAPTDGAAHWVFMWEAGHVAAIHYLAGQIIPSRIEVERLKEDTVADAFAARDHLLKRLGGEARNEATAGLLTQPESSRGARDRLNFTFQHYASPEAEATKVAGNPPADLAARWSADLRGSAFRATEQKRRSAVSQAARVLQAAAAALVLLVVGQSVAVGMRVVISKKGTLIESQKNTVAYVDSRLALLKQISKFTDNQIHPIEMLGVINPYRPSSVRFNQTRIFNTTAGNSPTPIPTLSANCTSNSTEDVSAFVTSLQALKSVDLDINKLNIKSGLAGTTFQVNLTFKSVPEFETFVPEVPKLPDPVPDDINPDSGQLNPNGPYNPNDQNGPFQQQGQNPGDNGPQAGPQQDYQPAPVPDAPSGPSIVTGGQAAPAPAPAPTPAPAAAPAPAPAPAAEQ